MERNTVPSPWLTPTECAAYMHKRRAKVDEWVRSGVLPSHKEPNGENGVLIHAQDADALIMSWPSASRSLTASR